MAGDLLESVLFRGPSVLGVHGSYVVAEWLNGMDWTSFLGDKWAVLGGHGGARIDDPGSNLVSKRVLY